MSFDEQLWAALIEGEGNPPEGYVDYQIMKEMGWTYKELRECPAQVVYDIIRFMNTERKFSERGTK